MIDGLGSGSSGGGGVSSSMLAQMLAGYAQETWVDENYVSISYFNRLFQAFNGSTAVNPNDLTTAITNIKAMVDFWSAGAVSALGYGGGGGGGVTLNEPLSSINSAALGTPSASGQTLVWNGSAWTYGSGGSGGASALSQLSDVQLTSPTNGQALVYNATSGKWENQTIGGGSGTLTSIGLVMPTGFSVSPATLTANGSFTVSFLNGYRLLTNDDETFIQYGYTAYQWGDHAQAGYATQSWVQQQGYATALSGLSDVVLTTPSNGQVLVYNSTSGKWVNGDAPNESIVYDATSGVSGTAAVTSSPYTAAIWRVDLSGKIDTLTTGTTILLKVPVAGNGSYGTLLRIDGTSSSTDSSTNLYPVCANVTTMVGTRYGVGCIIALTFDADQTGQTFYYQSSSKKTSVEGGTGWTKPGCWKIADYDANTIAYQLRTNSYTRPMSDKVYRYRLLFTSADNTKWVPANTSTSTNATASRSACQTKIDPFGEIVYYGSTSSVAAGSSPGATVLWQQYTLTLGYSFNTTGSALVLTHPAPVYLKCAPQSDGSAIIDSTTPYVQALPTTADGKIYILLGYAYGETTIELVVNHPVYYYKDGAIRRWTNASVSGNITGVNNITTGSSGGLLSGFQGIELNTNGTLTTSGGYIDFHYNGSSSDFTSRIIEDASGRIQMNAQVYIPSAKSLRIGDGLLSWDSTNNALKVTLYDGSAANFYSLGGVSALGFQSGSGGTNSATIGTLAVTTQLNMSTGTRIWTEQDLYIGNEDSEGWVFMADVCSQSGSTYWSINEAGEAKFAQFVRSPKFYFDTSKYLYVSGYNLMFYDGQDSYKVKLEQA